MTPAIRVLQAKGIAHQVSRYALDATSTQYGLAAAEALSLSPESVFKTLLAELANERLVVALIPVAGSLDLKALASAAGSRNARLAEATQAERATGYLIGGISPLGQKKRLVTFIDESALTLARLHVSGGRRGLEVSLSPQDLISLTDARTVALTRR